MDRIIAPDTFHIPTLVNGVLTGLTELSRSMALLEQSFYDRGVFEYKCANIIQDFTTVMDLVLTDVERLHNPSINALEAGKALRFFLIELASIGALANAACGESLAWTPNAVCWDHVDEFDPCRVHAELRMREIFEEVTSKLSFHALGLARAGFNFPLANNSFDYPFNSS